MARTFAHRDSEERDSIGQAQHSKVLEAGKQMMDLGPAIFCDWSLGVGVEPRGVFLGEDASRRSGCHQVTEDLKHQSEFSVPGK